MPKREKVWQVREDYRKLLKRIKKLFPTVLAHVKTKRIALVGLQARHCPYMARIYCNRRPWSLLTEQYDYLIIFWSTRFDGKKRSYKLYVMLHELYHIRPDGFEKGSPGYRKLIRHDIEDYRELRQVYGIHLQKLKDIYKGERNLLQRSKEHDSRDSVRIA